MVSGHVKVRIKPNLPFKDISLPLGNHFAGEKVVTDPILIDKPCLGKHHISILSTRKRHMDVRGGGLTPVTFSVKNRGEFRQFNILKASIQKGVTFLRERGGGPRKHVHMTFQAGDNDLANL